MFATQPIVEASITHADAGKLAKAPWLRVRGALDKSGAGPTRSAAEGGAKVDKSGAGPTRSAAEGGAKVNDGGFAMLVAAPNVQQLTSLNVTATGLGKKALAALGSHLPHCRTLVLTSNLVGDEGVAQLAAWKHLGQVETLYLSGVTSPSRASRSCSPRTSRAWRS